MPGITKILRLEFNSGILRYLLSLYYKPNRYYRIPFGHLKGLKMWYDRSINYHAILGLWEQSNFNLLDNVVRRLLKDKDSLTVHDVGANIGLFSLFFTKYSSRIKVVAFEAAPETTKKLEKNVTANEATNIKIVQQAVSDENGTVDFFLAHHHKSSLLYSWASDQGNTHVEKVSVPAITLDAYVERNDNCIPDLIKIDVEGGGASVLAGARQIIAAGRPIILFESHLPVEDDAVIDLLKTLRYKAYRISNSEWVINQTANYREPDGVWGTMLLIPFEKNPMFNDIL
jgi:FkbM family methyltransferase